MALLPKPTTEVYEIHVEPIGDNTLSSMRWKLRAGTSSLSTVLIEKDKAVEIDENTFQVIVSTAPLSPGRLWLEIQMEVLDANAPGGKRGKNMMFETEDDVVDGMF